MPVDLDRLVTGPCIATFGEPAVHIPQAGSPQTITGVFDAAYLPLLPFGGGDGREPMAVGGMGDTVSAKPALGVQLSQFITAPDQGHLLTLRGTTYFIHEVQADGQGAAMLLLNKAKT